ncbi:ABC transporter ATP-binding protein [Nocardioides sp. BP30]|uniref:ABC transporter ATP-binding protein n=1 Tax=Nocardioides sp. BP30 TaxID=3036374 RepID=UPI002468AEB7|nr:ABC transporter ATP-binding protein [Nocardioides sp. BP30]WGL51982.1 ABC transporter ATP-binding protein [Nocardioides sp. BP30]
MSEQNPSTGSRTGTPKGQLQVTERVVRQHGPGPMGGGMVGQKAHDFTSSSRRLVRRLTPQRNAVLGVLALAIVSVFLMSLGPRLLGHATNVIVAGWVSMRAGGPGIDFTALAHKLELVFAVYVLGSLLSASQGWLLNGVVQRTVWQLRADVEDKVNRLPLEYFDRQPRGELLSRVTNDIDNVSQTLQQTMSQLLTSLLTVVFVLVQMFWISPLLALVALVCVPIAMLVTGNVMKRSQGQFIAQWRRTGALNAHIEETFSGHDLVTVFGRQEEVEETFREQNEGLYEASFKAQFVSGLIMPLMMFVGNLQFVVVAVVGGLRVSSGHITVGDLQAFIQYSRQFTQPLTTVASMTNLLQSGVASAERVFELLDAEEQLPDVAGSPGEGSAWSAIQVASGVGEPSVRGATGDGEVRFEHVGFRYDEDKPLIEDLSLVASPGQTVAIVGPTGAGKTTLVNLIMRFYELRGGRITLDGVDITAMPRAALRSRIGMVLQDTWLFEGTIRDNIVYGRPDATEEEMLAAARATFVDRFVHSLPDGYDTMIEGDGGKLSAGERQLLTIARAFLAQPDLLILDEATSSVDTRTELLLQQAMAALRTDRTSFVIAHRLSTIRDADLILVMEDGSIVEQGDHESLLAAGGAYARLYRSQFAGAVGEEVVA